MTGNMSRDVALSFSPSSCFVGVGGRGLPIIALFAGEDNLDPLDKVADVSVG